MGKYRAFLILPSFSNYPKTIQFFIKNEKLLSGFTLCLLISIIWIWVFNRTTCLSWQTPLTYEGDSWLIFGFAKAYMDGDIFPILYKSVAHLNAPFFANWNDYPFTEDLILAIMGWLGRLVGLFTAANIMVMLAHILAGFGFWYVGRELRYRNVFAFSGAVLFAFSHYIFCRNLPHLVLSYYWHIPFMLLVSWWVYSPLYKPIKLMSRKWWLAVMISAISGVLNPYYTWIFLQFIGFSVLLHVAKKQYNAVLFPFLLIGAALLTFLAMNADTLTYSYFYGSNPIAVSRSLVDLELYALKTPELIFPPAYHRWHSWASYGQNHYFSSTLIKGEMGSPYLGLVGLTGLILLVGINLYRFFQGKLQLISVHAWQILWILLFALTGGINLLLGTFGLILFRGTNRYSIFILAIALLFLVRQLSRECPRKWAIPLALGIMVIGLWDQLPPQASLEAIQKTSDSVQSDRRFAQQLESQLPPNAMVFQLPVASFPEIPPIIQMADYEHFRPYLFTRNLRYTYGTNKGRGDADWQMEISNLSPEKMVTKLESYGFGAILINRKGYADRGIKIISEISSTYRKIILDNGEWIAIKLTPSKTPNHTELPLIYGIGWSGDEVDHRWSTSSYSEIIIINNDKVSRVISVEFDLITIQPRKVEISINKENLQSLSLSNNDTPNRFRRNKIVLHPGVNAIGIKTDTPAEIPGNSDPRKLSFGITNVKIENENEI